MDPMSEFEPGFSPFHYVRNSPISRFDPDGMQDTTYSIPPIIVEAPRYIPSKYDLYYDVSIGSPFGTVNSYRRVELYEDLKMGLKYGLSLSFSAMGSGNTIYSGIQLGRRGVTSSLFRPTFIVTKSGCIHYLTCYNYHLSKYNSPIARYWFGKNLRFYRSIGRFGSVSSIGLSVINFALAEDTRARWQAGFAGFFAWGGSALGAWGGSFVTPVAGTIAGGMAGAAFGDYFGNIVGGWYYDTFIDER